MSEESQPQQTDTGATPALPALADPDIEGRRGAPRAAAVADPALNSALEAIFDNIVCREGGRRTLSAIHAAAHRVPRPQQRKRRLPGPATPAASGSRRAMSLPPLRSLTSGVESHALHLRCGYSPHCEECQRLVALEHQAKLVAAVEREATARVQLQRAEQRGVETVHATHFIDLAAMAARGSDAARGARRRSRDGREQRLEELRAAERVARRGLEAEHGTGFGEVVAFNRLLLQQRQQLDYVASSGRAMLALQAADALTVGGVTEMLRRQNTAARQRSRVMLEEDQGRDRLLRLEAGVWGSMSEAFRGRLGAVMSHSNRVHQMRTLQQHRLDQCDLERQRLFAEETVARDRHAAAERKAHETLASLAVDSKRRQLAALQRRTAEEQQRRDALEAEEGRARDVAEGDEASAAGALAQAGLASLAAAAEQDQRNGVKHRRAVWREGVEAEERAAMLAADDEGWAALRAAYAQRVVFPSGDEAAERQALAVAFEARRRAVLWKDRDRRRLGVVEQQARASVAAAWVAAVDAARVRVLDAAAAGPKAGVSVDHDEARARAAMDREYVDAVAALSDDARCLAAALPVLGDEGSLEETVSSPNSAYVLTGLVPLQYGLVGAAPVPIVPQGWLELTTGAPVAAVTDLACSVRILNPAPGDALVLGDDAPAGPHLTVSHSGPVDSLLRSLCLVPTTTPCLAAVVPRAVEVCLDELRAVVRLVVRPPVLTTAAPLVERWRPVVGAAWPLRPSGCDNADVASLEHWAFVARPKHSRVHVVLEVAGGVPGHVIEWRPDAVFVKTGKRLTLEGRPVLVVVRQAPTRIELDYDAVAVQEADLCRALGGLRVHRGDPSAPLPSLPLLTVTESGRDADVVFDTVLRLDLFAAADAPRFALPSGAAYVRAAATRCLVDDDAPLPGVHVPEGSVRPLEPTGRVVLPGGGSDIAGVTLTAELDPWDGRAGLSLRPAAVLQESVVVQRAKGKDGKLGTKGRLLLHDHRGDPQDVGSIAGLGTHRLRVVLAPDAAVTTEALAGLLRSLELASNRTVYDGRSTVSMALRLAMVHEGRESVSTVPVHVLPPLLQPNTRRRSSFVGRQQLTYREGTGFKPLPAFPELKPDQVNLSLDACLRVRLVAGVEDSDELDVLGKDHGLEHGLHVLRHKGHPVAWWHPRPGTAVDLSDSERGPEPLAAGSPTELLLYITGEEGIPALRAPGDPYRYAARQVPSTVTAAGLNLLLRSVVYRNTSNDPALQKVVVVELDDGRAGVSRMAFDINIEAVDDPTEIVFAQQSRAYHQHSGAARGGFPLMPRVKLEDPDSDNFHDGYLLVELAQPSFDPGDSLGLLTPAQQLLHVHPTRFTAVDAAAYDDMAVAAAAAFQGNSSSGQLPPMAQATLSPAAVEEGRDGRTALSVLRDAADDSGPVDTACISLVDDLCPRPALEWCGERLYYDGVKIGYVSLKHGNTKDPAQCTAVRIDFTNEARFVSFPTAEYCARCFAFENWGPRMRPGQRTVNITLLCGSSTTHAKLPVLGVPACIAVGTGQPLTVKYDEAAAKPRAVLPGAVCAVEGLVVHDGYLEAVVEGGDPLGDELFFDSVGSIKGKEKTVFHGKELVAAIAAPRKPSELRLDFARLTTELLTALIKALSFRAVPGLAAMTPGPREVRFKMALTNDAEPVRFTTALEIGCRNGPVTLATPNSAVVHVACPHAPPTPLFTKLTVIFPPGGQRSSFPAGSRALATLSDAPLPFEFLTYTPGPGYAVAPTKGDPSTHDVTRDGAPVGRLLWAGQRCGGVMSAGQALEVVLLAELPPSGLSTLLGGIAYCCGTGSLRSLRSQRATLLLREAGRSENAPGVPLQPGRLVVAVSAVPPPMELRVAPITARTWEDTPVVPHIRLQLTAPTCQGVAVTATLVGPHWNSEDTLQVLTTAPDSAGHPALSQDGDRLYALPMANERGAKRALLGTAVNPEPHVLTVAFDAATAPALRVAQYVLRRIVVSCGADAGSFSATLSSSTTHTPGRGKAAVIRVEVVTPCATVTEDVPVRLHRE